MLSKVSFSSLVDFNGLSVVREAVASHNSGLLITGLPPCPSTSGSDAQLFGKRVRKSELNRGHSLSILMQHLHKLSHAVFKNLSHALELPWERYLCEMHEYDAPGADEIHMLSSNEPVPFPWSTLTIVTCTAHPHSALVLFGTALAVFSEDSTPHPSKASVDLEYLEQLGCDPKSDRIAYHVRPNDDVFYTRTAGALMEPMSCEEIQKRQRIKDLKLVI